MRTSPLSHAKFIVLSACLLFGNATFSHAQGMDKLGASKQPIEINADALEVFQNENKAVFTGKVDAVQGTVRLKSDKMVVFYKPAGEATQGQNSISKLEVNGNVLLSTPQETAKGDNGVYQVDKEVITLTGNVMLTKDKNVVRGDRLDYDVKRGHSKIVGGNAGVASTTGGGRVKGVFVPEQKP